MHKFWVVVAMSIALWVLTVSIALLIIEYPMAGTGVLLAVATSTISYFMFSGDKE